jgi:hypothetical protein
MSTSFASKLRQATLVLTVAMISSFYASQSFAYTAEQAQACKGDAMRLCSAEIPNISAITACMYKHKDQLSAGCLATMSQGQRDQYTKAMANKQ